MNDDTGVKDGDQLFQEITEEGPMKDTLEAIAVLAGTTPATWREDQEDRVKKHSYAATQGGQEEPQGDPIQKLLEAAG